MMGLGPEAYNALACTAFNYVVTQLGAWAHLRAERELYQARVEEIASLERLGVFARQLHVRGEPGEAVNIGTTYEDGMPMPVEAFVAVTSQATDFVDAEGRVWSIDAEVSLHVEGISGTRASFEVDNVGEKYDFRIKPEQTLFTLMTEAGIYPIPRGAPFGTPYYHLANRVEALGREVSIRGMLMAWPVLLLTPALFAAAQFCLPTNSEARIGVLQVFSSIWLFVCISGAVFASPFPRHKSRLPVRRWQPELR